MINLSGDKLIIGLDLDGVIIDHSKNKIKFAKEFGFKLKRQETSSEVMKTKLPLKIYKIIQKKIYNNLENSLQSPLYKGVKTALNYLKKESCPYFLISRRKNKRIAVQLLRQKELWPRFFNKNNVFFVKKDEDKNIFVKKLKINLYLDDKIEVLDKLSSISHKLLFNPLKTYNQNEVSYKLINSWPQFIKFIRNQ